MADREEPSGAHAVKEERKRLAHHDGQVGSHQPAPVIEDGEDPDGFPERVVAAAGSSLFTPLLNREETHIGNCEINLATLQRMTIHAIQRDLVRLTSKIVRYKRMEVDPKDDETDSQAVQVRGLMKEYCEYQLSFAIFFFECPDCGTSICQSCTRRSKAPE